LSEILVGDVVARLRADTQGFDRSMDQAAQKLRATEQAAQQTGRQLSQLPFNAIQNSIDAFSRSIQQAGNNQGRYQAAITQANEALRQFNVTTNASGQAVDQFGQRLSKASTEALRGFQAGVREAQAELNQLQQFGINAAAGGGASGGLLQSVLGVAGGIGVATSIAAIVRQLKEFVVESVLLSAKMQDLNLAFRAIEGSATAANKTLTFLFETSNKLGVNFETVADGFKRLDQAAKGSSLEGAGMRAVLENVLAGARALGLSQQQLGQLFVTLEQIMTKGRLSAEEYRKQLGNAVPGGLKLMADGLGLTTQALDRMAQSGLLPAEAGVVSLASAMGKLGQDPQKTVERLSSTFAELANETTAWMTALGDAIATKLKPFLDTLVGISKELREIFGIRAPGTTATVPERQSVIPSAYTELITKQAQTQALDPGLLSRLIRAESNFNPNARSPAGALGLGQVMLPTAQGVEMGVTAENLLEPERNIRIAAKYLGEMLEQFRGFPDQVKLALAAYNAGPGNVMKAIKDIRLTEGEVTFERVLARLPKPEETGPYVARVLAPPREGEVAAGAAPATAAAAAGGLDPVKTMLDTINKTMEEIPKLEKEMDALVNSTLNWGGVLGENITKQVDDLLKKFTQTAELIARFPDVLAKMTPEQRAQLDVMTKQVAVLRARMEQETQTESGARKRIQEFRTAEAAEAQYLKEQAQAAAKAETDAITLDAMLERLRGAVRRPAENKADEAATRVRIEGARQIAEIEKEIVTLQRSQSLQKLRPAALGQFQELRKQVIDATEAQAKLASDEVLKQQIKPLEEIALRYGAVTTEITSQSDHVQELASKYGLATKEAIDLAKAEELAAQFTGTARQEAADKYLNTIRETIKARQAIEAKVPGLEQEALASFGPGMAARRGADFTQDLDAELERLQTPREERLTGKLRRQAGRKGVEISAEQEALLQQIETQERWNHLMDVTMQVGDQASQTITTGLLNIVDGTQRVGEAFQAMAKAILRSMAEIALNETFRTIFRLGLGLLGGAITGGAAPAAAGSTSTLGSSSSFIGGILGSQFTLQTAQGGAVVSKPTHILAGENPAMNPEYVVNTPQMQALMKSAMQASPSAGGQAAGNVSVILVDNRGAAEREAAQQRGMGRQVIIQEVVRDLGMGNGSTIGRMLKAGGH
jgi:tape measure domain-containing protein